ncbi:TetR/AcrR family transcriptional regulator [Nonomuraea sp. NPDC049309]|uniref:TetR/AcrR family transcriptional regulator n=1 Tax=Nonomuraea sp. NPDC049309 TaxID=3364350 RepID=UPI00371275B7
MVRWEPGAPDRLQQAALELFSTRGYEETTAAEIAQAVGLTERTFFRHFKDKREVLFRGQDHLVNAALEGVQAAPQQATPMEIVACALQSITSAFSDERRPWSRTRQQVIDRNPALQEREQHKMAMLAATIADAMTARGVASPTATLAARSGIAAFEVAFLRWIADGEQRPLTVIIKDVLDELRTLLS